MRYCATCGVPLYEPALAAGNCLSCGAAIAPDAPSLSPDQAARLAQQQRDDLPTDYRPTEPYVAPLSEMSYGEYARTPSHQSPTTPTHGYPAFPGAAPEAQQKRLYTVFVLVGMGAVVIFALFFVLLHQALRPATVTSPGGNPGDAGSLARQTQGPGETPQPIAQTTPVATGTIAGSSPTPNGTPLTSPTPLASPSPGAAPAITLAPSSMSGLVCLNSSTKFSIVNSGGSPLNWTATVVSGNYTLAPSSGALAGGAQQSVTVSGISSSGAIKVSDPHATNSPQTFTITCGV